MRTVVLLYSAGTAIIWPGLPLNCQDIEFSPAIKIPQWVSMTRLFLILPPLKPELIMIEFPSMVILPSAYAFSTLGLLIIIGYLPSLSMCSKAQSASLSRETRMSL